MIPVYLKDGVDVQGLHAPLWRAAHLAAAVWEAQDLGELVITSAIRPQTAERSLHPHGLAIDLRRWGLIAPREAVQTLKALLGEAYDVVLEADHVHVEYDTQRITRA